MSAHLQVKSPNQVPRHIPQPGVVFGETQTPNIRFATSRETTTRVDFNTHDMGNSTSRHPRTIPKARAKSDLPHPSTQDQGEELTTARGFSRPLPNDDLPSSYTGTNFASKTTKSLPTAIAKTHRKIVSLGALAKATPALTPDATLTTPHLSSATSATVPGPGKSSAKLKVVILFDKPFYIAGGELTGYLELTSLTKESLGVADIALELTGFEGPARVGELAPAAAPNIGANAKPGALGPQHPAPAKTFYRTRLLLQDRAHPSPAVQGAYPDAEGFWPARKGKTAIPFLLRLAPTLPNAIVTSHGRVTYHLEAIIQLKSGIYKEVANFGRAVIVLERWEPSEVTVYRGRGVRGETRKRLFMGGPRHLELDTELVASLVAAGSLAYVRLTVRNETTKKVQGVRLTLLQTAGAGEGLGQNAGAEAPTWPVAEKMLKEADLKFSPGDERTCLVALEIPANLLSLRRTVLLKVNHTLQVALVSSLSKDLTVDLPIYISHPASWSDPCPALERKPEPPTTDPLLKPKPEGQDARSRTGSPPPHAPSGLDRGWAGSTPSRSKRFEAPSILPRVGEAREGYFDAMPEEPGSNSEATSPPNASSRAPSVSSFPLSGPATAETHAAPNGRPAHASFFRHVAHRPTTPSEASASEIFVGGRRYQLADPPSPADPAARPHTVLDGYQIQSRPSNFPSQLTRHSSYVSSEHLGDEETMPAAESGDARGGSDRSRIKRDTFEPSDRGCQDSVKGPGAYAFMDTPPDSSPPGQKAAAPCEEEQYQWSTANQAPLQAVAHHTPERELSRRPTHIAIKRKSSTKVRTRAAICRPPLPGREPKPVSSASSSHTPASPPNPSERTLTGSESVGSQLALLQKQMSLLLASLQPAAPHPPLRAGTGASSPAPHSESPPTHPNRKPAKKPKPPPTSHNLHYHRAILNAKRSDKRSEDDSDWV
ncbi:hypothetical protein L0F63_004038 [Massospora cicadina]|nr:hypothetical protein L0F63_004038 [Massospora cicadina]